MKLFGSSTSTRDGSAAGGTQTGQGRRGEPAGSRRNRLRRLIVATAVTGAVTGVVFALVLPTFASYGPVWRVAQSLSWSWLAALAAAALLNVATFPLPWIVALPGLGFLNALRMTQASTAFSLVVPGGAPIGMAASFGMLRSWRLAGRPVAVAVALTGIWNQLTTFAFPMVGVALLALTGVASGRLKVLAISGLVAVVTVTTLLALALAKPRVAFAVGELSMRYLGWLRRGRRAAPPTWGGGSAVLLRTETVALLRQRWALLTATTLANQLTGYLLFLLTLRAVGITSAAISIVESFAAWSAGRLLASLPITPGGIGFVEVGLAGILVGFGGPNTEVVAAILIYRAFSILPTLALGTLAAATWRLQTPQFDEP